MENETVKIELNTDKPCTKCGQMGAMKNGLCFDCTTDKITGIHTREIDLMNEALVSASKQINSLLAVHSLTIHKAYFMAGDAKLSVGLTVELSPSEVKKDAITIRAKINFIESRIKDESVAEVSKQGKLGI